MRQIVRRGLHLGCGKKDVLPGKSAAPAGNQIRRKNFPRRSKAAGRPSCRAKVPSADVELLSDRYAQLLLFRRLSDRLRALHLGGAVFELGNLPERVELRIGQEIRGRLDVGERDEHDAIRYRVVLTRGQ